MSENKDIDMSSAGEQDGSRLTTPENAAPQPSQQAIQPQQPIQQYRVLCSYG